MSINAIFAFLSLFSGAAGALHRKQPDWVQQCRAPAFARWGTHHLRVRPRFLAELAATLAQGAFLGFFVFLVVQAAGLLDRMHPAFLAVVCLDVGAGGALWRALRRSKVTGSWAAATEMSVSTGKPPVASTPSGHGHR